MPRGVVRGVRASPRREGTTMAELLAVVVVTVIGWAAVYASYAPRRRRAAWLTSVEGGAWQARLSG